MVQVHLRPPLRQGFVVHAPKRLAQGHLAQWLERLLDTQKVGGSNPPVPTLLRMKNTQQKGAGLPLIIGAIALIAIAAGVGFVIISFPPTPQPSGNDSQPTINTGPQDQEPFAGALLAGTQQTPLLDFVKSDYAGVQQTNKIIVLFFYANWCPTCKKSFPDAQAAFNDFAKNQVGVVGFRVNYNDDETDQDEKDLAKKYEITYQDTKVIIKEGQVQTKSVETWDKARYLKEINNI
jgi:thiol-disulfide isomerase/thioredoxin